MKNKKAQEGPMGMSFGVIFAIFLIIVFIWAAFYGIRHFLQLSKCTQIGNFYDFLQRKVDEAFYSSSVENVEFKINLPKEIEKVCFANLSAQITNREDYEELADFEFEDANLFLLPKEAACNMPYKKINRLNIVEITKNKNPYCVYADESLKLSKKIYDKTVIIEGKELSLSPSDNCVVYGNFSFLIKNVCFFDKKVILDFILNEEVNKKINFFFYLDDGKKIKFLVGEGCRNCSLPEKGKEIRYYFDFEESLLPQEIEVFLDNCFVTKKEISFC